ncbi:MAG: hypothetical protein ACYC6A_14745, partial [Armatimonadota bacterium]
MFAGQAGLIRRLTIARRFDRRGGPADLRAVFVNLDVHKLLIFLIRLSFPAKTAVIYTSLSVQKPFCSARRPWRARDRIGKSCG